MKAFLFVMGFLLITSVLNIAGAQSVTLYTAGPDGLKGIAKAFTEKMVQGRRLPGHQRRRAGAPRSEGPASRCRLLPGAKGCRGDRGLVGRTSPEAKLRREWPTAGRAQGGAASHSSSTLSRSRRTSNRNLVRSRCALVEGCVDHA
jgi:hypothetical protein